MYISRSRYLLVFPSQGLPKSSIRISTRDRLRSQKRANQNNIYIYIYIYIAKTHGRPPSTAPDARRRGTLYIIYIYICIYIYIYI